MVSLVNSFTCSIPLVGCQGSRVSGYFGVNASQLQIDTLFFVMIGVLFLILAVMLLTGFHLLVTASIFVVTIAVLILGSLLILHIPAFLLHLIGF